MWGIPWGIPWVFHGVFHGICCWLSDRAAHSSARSPRSSRLRIRGVTEGSERLCAKSPLSPPLPPIPFVPPYFSSTWRLGEHLMASQVFQWRCRTLYTWPNPPEPIFSQLLNSLSSKVLSSPMAQGEPPSLAMASAVPGHRPAAQRSPCARPGESGVPGGTGLPSLPGTGQGLALPQVSLLSRDRRAGLFQSSSCPGATLPSGAMGREGSAALPAEL